MDSQIFSLLPANVLIQILNLVEEAHPPLLYNLLFIKSTKPTAELLIYRRVHIRGPKEHFSNMHWPAHEKLIARILDPQDNVSSLIRELSIQHWPGPGSLDFGTDVLERLLESVTNLLIFKWESNPHIPLTVLSKFHTLLPDALLEVTNWDRGYSYVPLDLDLLRSPRLHSLRLRVLQTVLSNNGADRQISEYPVLKQILQRSSNLRVLKLGHLRREGYEIGTRYQRWHSEYKTEGDGELNLQFQRGDKFPALTELTIVKGEYLNLDRGYDMNMAHCIAWKKAMNWKALSKLDLGNVPPLAFFKVFRGYIPQTTVLKFRLSRGQTGKEDPAPLTLATKQFIDSIKALKELVIEDWTKSFFVELCPTIRGHKNSLRSLEVNPSAEPNYEIVNWASASLVQLLEDVSALNTLTLAIDLSKNGGYWNSRRPRTWPNKPFSLLCKFPAIESLLLRIRLPAGNPPPDLDKEAVTKLATDLFKGFYANNTKSKLDHLNLQVQRMESVYFEGENEAGVTVDVTRSVRGDSPSPLEGGFVVNVSDEFDGY